MRSNAFGEIPYTSIGVGSLLVDRELFPVKVG
jgi:hypothetical protein